MTSNTSPLLRTVDEMLLDAGETDPRLAPPCSRWVPWRPCRFPSPARNWRPCCLRQTSQLARHRLRRRHRTAAVGLAVIAGMGLGVTGVAATASAPKRQCQPFHPADVAGLGTVLDHRGDSRRQRRRTCRTPARSLPRRPAILPDGVSAGRGRPPAGRELPGRKPTRPAAPAQDCERAQQAGEPGSGRAAASPGKPAADGGASRNAAGATRRRRLAGRDRREGPGAWRSAGSDPAGGLEKAGKLVSEAPAAVGQPGLSHPRPDNNRPGNNRKNRGRQCRPRFNLAEEVQPLIRVYLRKDGALRTIGTSVRTGAAAWRRSRRCRSRPGAGRRGTGRARSSRSGPSPR